MISFKILDSEKFAQINKLYIQLTDTNKLFQELYCVSLHFAKQILIISIVLCIHCNTFFKYVGVSTV